VIVETVGTFVRLCVIPRVLKKSKATMIFHIDAFMDKRLVESNSSDIGKMTETK
jgi:hypothetical protein